MELALFAVVLCAIAALGLYVVTVLPRTLAANSETERARLLEEAERSRLLHEQALENRLLESQARLANQQAQTFLEMATPHLKQVNDLGQQALKQRQGEIDKGLEEVRKELQTMREFVASTDAERMRSITSVSEMVKESRLVTEKLHQGTTKLNEALAGSQSRGQWGERIAEDVLRIAGFIEGVNYRRWETTSEGNRPDFTFLLPDDRKLHMDVKMPMAAFKRYLDAEIDSERETAAKEFLRDTKQRIKEVTTRDYINPADGTLDYTLVFIPNEQVYGFIHERDPEIVDFALKQRVVICSPLTLFAVLAVIRQSLENFRLEARTKEIQTAIAKFRRQWDMYVEEMDKVGRSIKQTGDRWEDLVGKRQRQLDRHIERVDVLRSGSDGEPLLAAPVAVEDEIFELTTGADGPEPRVLRNSVSGPSAEPADASETPLF